MSLKEAGIRGSLRNVSVGTLATPDGTVDNFEEILYEDKSNTLSDYYNGSLSNYERGQTTVDEGSYALSSTGGSFDVIYAPDTGGLPRYPDQGETFRCHIQSPGGASAFCFGAQGTDEFYIAAIDAADDSFALQHRPSNDILDSSPESIATDTWYIVEVDWGTDNSITARLLDNSENQLTSVSASDSRLTDGGIAFRSQGAGSHYDNVRVV